MNRWDQAYNETRKDLDKISVGIEKLKSYLYRSVEDLKIEKNSSMRSFEKNYTNELNRLEDVYYKLSSGLRNMDYNIVPLDNWKEAKNSTTNMLNSLDHSGNYDLLENRGYANSLDILNKLNFYTDELIKTLAPYCDFKSKRSTSIENDLVLQQHQLSKLLEEFKVKSSNILQTQDKLLSQASNKLNSISKIDKEFQRLNEQYFVGTDEQPLKDRWDLLNEQITRKSNEIDVFYRTLITDEKSIRQEIMSAGDIIQKLRNDSSIAYENLKDKINEIKVFHQDIYGSIDGKSIGLKSDIESSRKELIEFEALQKQKYDALNDQIESLLPGATSAGLSSAYHTLSNSYDKSIQYNTWIFFGSIIILSIISFIFLSSSIIEFNSIENIMTFLVYRLPIVIPVVWLAVFASKRRSEAERLKQEYAHKEALAKSYQSFKMQIEELDVEAKELLMEKLLSSAIDTISNNASLTLDKKHGDSLPLTSLIERTVDKTIDKFPTRLKSE